MQALSESFSTIESHSRQASKLDVTASNLLREQQASSANQLVQIKERVYFHSSACYAHKMQWQSLASDNRGSQDCG